MSGVDAWVLAGAVALAWVVLIGLLVRFAGESRARRRQYEDLHMRSLAMRWTHELLELRVRELEQEVDEALQVLTRLRQRQP